MKGKPWKKRKKNAEKQEKPRYGSCHCTTRESTKEGSFKSCKYQPSNVAGPRAGFSGTQSFGSTGWVSRVSLKREEEFTKGKHGKIVLTRETRTETEGSKRLPLWELKNLCRPGGRVELKRKWSWEEWERWDETERGARVGSSVLIHLGQSYLLSLLVLYL